MAMEEKEGFTLDDALSLVDDLLSAGEEEEFALDYEVDFGDILENEPEPIMELAEEPEETPEEAMEPEMALEAEVSPEPEIESVPEVPLAEEMELESEPDVAPELDAAENVEISDSQESLEEVYEEESDDVRIEEELADLDSSFDTFFSEELDETEENEEPVEAHEDIDRLLDAIPDEPVEYSEPVEEDLSNSAEEDDALMSLLSELSGEDEEDVEVEDLVPTPKQTKEEGQEEEDALDPIADLLAMTGEDAPEMNSSEPVSVDDIFQDALSAVAYSENEEEDISLEEFMNADLGEQLLKEEDPKKQKKKEKADKKSKKANKKERIGEENMGFFQRIFGNIITEDTAEEEARQRLEDEVDEEQKKQDKETRKHQAKLDKEAKGKLAEEEKERKKQLKAEQAAKKEAEKKEKQRLKEERRAEEANEVVGKINPIGATIVVIFFVTIGAAIILSSSLVARNRSLKAAENQFAAGNYVEAYKTISAVDVNEDEKPFYQKILLCSQMQKEIQSFERYQTLNMPLEALDSLVKGIATYDGTMDEADEVGVSAELEKIKEDIVARMKDNFGLSEEQARNITKIESRVEYTNALQSVVDKMPKK